MVLVIAYGWLVGPSASVRRAVVAGVIYLSIGLLGHRPRALPVLSATALIVCLASPLTLVDVGAWLSFAATAGIIVGAGPFVEWATRTQPPSPRPRWPRRLWIALLGIFGATVAAELMVFPITANVFSRVGVLGLVLNFVAVPAIAVVQVAGTAMTVLDAFWPSAAAVCGQVAGVASGWLIESARAVDRAPALVWRTPPSSLLWTAGYYAALGAAMWFRGRAPRRIAMAAAALCAVVIATAPWLSRAQPRSGWLRVTFLDVGQGDAIVVQFPSGESLLVDAGGAPGAFDIGDRVVTPALWALGIRALDWMALTHGDLDHAGGAPAVARDVRPREIWEGVPVPFDRGLLALRTQAHRDRIGWRGTRAGDRLEVGSAVVEVLHPPAPDWERRGVRNDDSLVLRIGFGAVDLLLTGDSGEEFEAAFDPMSAPAPMRILKVAHHGSRTSTSASFLQRFAPQMAIVSAGRGNPFGHPAPAVLERLQQARVVLFRTDQDGAVVMETDGRHVDVRTSSGRHWRMTSEAGP
jgi:competence protein ComEC